jgi:curli production assembly/transport component CsgF
MKTYLLRPSAMKPLQNALPSLQSLMRLFAVCMVAGCMYPLGTALAGDLVFSFTNPTFGGNPNNAASLLALANAQNATKAPDAPVVSALDKLTASLQAAMLSKLQTSVSGYVFDTKGSLVSGTQYTAGDFQVTVIVNPDRTVTLETLEISSGNSTTINLGNVTPPQ